MCIHFYCIKFQHFQIWCLFGNVYFTQLGIETKKDKCFILQVFCFSSTGHLEISGNNKAQLGMGMKAFFNSGKIQITFYGSVSVKPMVKLSYKK